MSDLQQMLIEELRKMDDLEDRPSPVSGGVALFYRGKEFAHFHNGNELDIRLTAKVIEAQGLSHPVDSIHHPNRSLNSPWIELRFKSPRDFAKIQKLVTLAIAKL